MTRVLIVLLLLMWVGCSKTPEPTSKQEDAAKAIGAGIDAARKQR